MQYSDNNKLFNSIISASKGKIDSKTIEKAKNGDLNDVLSSLPQEDAQRLKEALSDKEKTKQLLSSDAAKAIIKMLMDGKNNG